MKNKNNDEHADERGKRLWEFSQRVAASRGKVEGLDQSKSKDQIIRHYSSL